MQTWIMHIDMDAFYASIEQMDYPELKGKPVIVGGGERGVVSAASYEARTFGIHSAMPIFQARKRCPHGSFMPVRMSRYAEVSRQVMAVLEGFSPLVEKASVDEAYLDAGGLTRIFGPVEELGWKIKNAVCEASGLTCSVGIAPVRFLAKIASDCNKPDGLTIIRPEEVMAFLAPLPVGKLPGVGKKFQAALEQLGVHVCADVLRYPEDFWSRRFGKAGESLWRKANGQGSTAVVPYEPPKSESAENTFARDTLDREVLETWLMRQSERVGTSLRKQGLSGRTITLKIKYADFTSISRARTLAEPTDSTRLIYEVAVELLNEVAPKRKLRLIGVGVSGFGKTAREAQLSLLGPAESSLRNERDQALDRALDRARERFGRDAVIRGKLFVPKG